MSKIKVGTLISLFDNTWVDDARALRNEGFDYFEILPENTAVYTINDLQAHLGRKEIILHAPFVEMNAIARNARIAEGTYQALVEQLTPFVQRFHPGIITFHLGMTSYFSTDTPDFTHVKKLSQTFPQLAFENMPPTVNLWRRPYPNNRRGIETALQCTGLPMTFDIGHGILSKENVYSLLELYLSRIVNIHIHDVVRGKDHQKLGAGVLDVERIISILQRSAFVGYLTIELPPGNPRDVIQSYKILKNCIRKKRSW